MIPQKPGTHLVQFSDCISGFDRQNKMKTLYETVKTGLWTCHKNKSKQEITCDGKSGRMCADTEETDIYIYWLTII